MTIRNLVLIALSSVALMACHRQSVFVSYYPVPIDGWRADSVVQFIIPQCDTTNRYNIILHVRHTDGYPYQNMWLFVGNETRLDTMEFFLANDRGQWLGNGHAIKDMPVLYKENVTIKDSMTITIQQAMRELALKGVSEVGVEVKKNGKR